MIRPARFRSNPQTAASNAFQHTDAEQGASPAQRLAEQEFENLRAVLERAGVNVLVYADTLSPDKPDAIFPNNWFSTHGDGSVVLYPMQAANRRLERRADIFADLAGAPGFRVEKIIDLSEAEGQHQFLEGTGSMVLDRVNHVAYACLSPRTHRDLFNGWCTEFEYEAVPFKAVGDNGYPIYHTNVMMSVGERLAVVCLAAITAPDERERVRSRLVATGHEIVDITLAQVSAFAGNMLELADAEDESIFVMSQRASESLTEPQRAQIGRNSKIVSVPIDTIETHAGGGVRCMLAEIFLPKKS